VHAPEVAFRRAGLRAGPEEAAGVGGKTIDANAAISILNGQTLTEASIEAAAEAVADAADPRTDHRGSADYKRHIVKIFVIRILNGIARSEQKAA
jgi:carbon-monoxide dehydrogenase medium subunit